MIEEIVASPVPGGIVSSIAAAELTVVIPSYNERDNIPELLRRLDRVLAGIAWEAVVVDDDSPDRTWEIVRAIARRDPRVRCLRRVGRRGLAGACIEGILSSSAPVVAVMDADLQHDETLLPAMVAAIADGADLVVGSRYVDGGSASGLSSGARAWGSALANTLARRLVGVTLTDPMSGFFMIRRAVVETEAPKLAREGYKVLLDIAWSAGPALKVVELPYGFRERQAGESKLDALVTAEYLGLLLSKMFGGVLPVRFLMFAAVGLSGIAVHLAALRYATGVLGYEFEWAQFTAVVVAMTWNYVINNQLTYRDRRLTGFRFVTGLFIFYLACSIGTVGNVGVASWIHSFTSTDWVAGLAGAIMGAVFNYAASSVLIWKGR